jgi:hypothetical protein
VNFYKSGSLDRNYVEDLDVNGRIALQELVGRTDHLFVFDMTWTE